METLDLEQAARFLRLHPEELRRRAKAGRVPAAKVGVLGISRSRPCRLSALVLCYASASVASDAGKGT